MAAFENTFIEMPWADWQKPTGLKPRITSNFYLNDILRTDYVFREQILSDRKTQETMYYEAATDTNSMDVLIWPKYAYEESYYLPFFATGLLMITVGTYYPAFDLPELALLGYLGGGAVFYIEDNRQLKNKTAN